MERFTISGGKWGEEAIEFGGGVLVERGCRAGVPAFVAGAAR
jgi:hypothetical protein